MDIGSWVLPASVALLLGLRDSLDTNVCHCDIYPLLYSIVADMFDIFLGMFRHRCGFPTFLVTLVVSQFCRVSVLVYNPRKSGCRLSRAHSNVSLRILRKIIDFRRFRRSADSQLVVDRIHGTYVLPHVQGQNDTSSRCLDHRWYQDDRLGMVVDT